jgi:hypothetical protein
MSSLFFFKNKFVVLSAMGYSFEVHLSTYIMYDKPSGKIDLDWNLNLLD